LVVYCTALVTYLLLYVCVALTSLGMTHFLFPMKTTIMTTINIDPVEVPRV